MAKASCREVSLGFESGCETILRSMNKRFGVKEICEASRLLAEFGIRRMGFLLLGGNGETRASVEESLAFADSLRLDALKLTLGIRIYPQTDLALRAVEERGGPRCLDSLTGGISSEPVFGFVNLIEKHQAASANG